MKNLTVLLSLLFLIFFIGCSDDSTTNPPEQNYTIEVVINNQPYRTQTYIRIPYTLKLFEFEKKGFSLKRIIIQNDNNKSQLLTIEKEELPYIYKDPLGTNPYFTLDKISFYYLSIQLPIALGDAFPLKISHVFVFQDTIHNKEVIVEGGAFVPKTQLTSVVISSPVKGNNWIFLNQSSMGYHFYTLFFINNMIGTGERFAFDNIQFNESLTNYYDGDPTVNESYYNYKDTLFAVANGTIVKIKDGLPENNGNSHNVTFNNADELAGNYIIIDIGNGYYALYAHCNTGSIMVKQGDTVKEGDPIALLGNSGNSDAPHLHFQICDSPEFFLTNGIPFMLKKYTKIAEYGDIEIPEPVDYFNAMMEEFTIISFK